MSYNKYNRKPFIRSNMVTNEENTMQLRDTETRVAVGDSGKIPWKNVVVGIFIRNKTENFITLCFSIRP